VRNGPVPTKTPPVKLGAAITLAPPGRVVAAALGPLDRGGSTAVNAIHLDDIPPIDYGKLWWERSITSVANVTSRNVVEFLDLVAPASIRTESTRVR
jgi:propanol-preferring alcohol dehydrogenase